MHSGSDLTYVISSVEFGTAMRPERNGRCGEREHAIDEYIDRARRATSRSIQSEELDMLLRPEGRVAVP